MKKRFFRYLQITLVVVIVGWASITLYVERRGPAKHWAYGQHGGRKVLIVFDPDPFYNFDEQVCKALAQGLADQQLYVDVATVTAAEKMELQSFDIYIYCANTYNWRPDWAISDYVHQHENVHKNKPVIAVTLGAGATESSRNTFETIIKNSGARLVDSHTFWLWRPNEDAKERKTNIDLAVSRAYTWGRSVANVLNK